MPYKTTTIYDIWPNDRKAVKNNVNFFADFQDFVFKITISIIFYRKKLPEENIMTA